MLTMNSMGHSGELKSLRRQIAVLYGIILALAGSVVALWVNSASANVLAEPPAPKEKEITCDRLTCNRLTASAISILDEKGKVRIQAAMANDSTPYIRLYDSDSNLRIDMSASQKSAGVLVESVEGRRAEMGVNKANSYMALGNPKKGAQAYGIKMLDSNSGPLIGIKHHDDKEGEDRIQVGIIDGKYDVRIRR